MCALVELIIIIYIYFLNIETNFLNFTHKTVKHKNRERKKKFSILFLETRSRLLLNSSDLPLFFRSMRLDRFSKG